MSFFDDAEDRIIYGRYRQHGPTYDEKLPQCNRCGSLDVRWRQQGGKWALFSLQPGVVHVCEPDADDFGVVKE